MIVEPCSDNFVAKITDVDFRQPLTSQEVTDIKALMDRYAVLCFSDQFLTQTELRDLAANFGPLVGALTSRFTNSIQSRMEYAEVNDVSNVDAEGNIASKTHSQSLLNLGNQNWHIDGSWGEISWGYSLLNAVATTSWGGETQFADLRAAYEALDERTANEVADLVAEHFALHTRILLSQADLTDEQMNAYPPVHRPLIYKHPSSGRTLLFVSGIIQEIKGMSVPEGRMFARELVEHATQPQFVHTHSWKPGDLLFWDNQAVMHRGRRFPLDERREMRRVATLNGYRAMVS